MYVIVEIAGLQYKVEQDQQIYVNRLKGEEGDVLSFDKVLLADDNGSVTVGAPAISGAVVEAKILEHLKGDKVIVFKKKRRKGYKKKNGHRQYLSKIQISSIALAGGKKVAAKKATPKKAAKEDLTLVEGIGPKVAELLNENGIVTFVDLSKASVEKIKEILEAKGGIYKSIQPDTWPKQALLASEGKFDELKAWQDELDGGKETK